MIIAHDLGTTGNKATLVDQSGRLVSSVTISYDTDFGPGGKAEQSPHDWWVAVCTATRRLLDAVPGARDRVQGVTFSGQMMGAVLVDAHGEPVRPAIIWADTRAQQESAALVERVGMERGYAITGHRLNPTYSLSKVMWIKKNEPGAFDRATTMLLAKDYMILKLTGRRVTDPSDASSTNAYDQARAAWSEELIDAAGLPNSMFPEILPSTAVAGGVTEQAAAETGLRPGTAVVIGGGDGPMAALGSGIVDRSSGAYTYLGTSSWVSLASDAPLHDPQMRTMTFNHVIPDRFVPTATMQAGGGSLQWIMDVLAPEVEGRYEQHLATLAATEASADGLYFLPHLLGERSPYWNPKARAAFVGLARHHGPDHLVRAVVEGVAFNLRTGLMAFLEAGIEIPRVDSIGGAAKSSEILQVLADVWGVHVRRRDLVDEATAIGAAIVGGVGVGLFADFGIATTLSSVTANLSPDAEASTRYAAAHGRFVDAYRRLEPWFDTV